MGKRRGRERRPRRARELNIRLSQTLRSAINNLLSLPTSHSLTECIPGYESFPTGTSQLFSPPPDLLASSWIELEKGTHLVVDDSIRQIVQTPMPHLSTTTSSVPSLSSWCRRSRNGSRTPEKTTEGKGRGRVSSSFSFPSLASHPTKQAGETRLTQCYKP